DLLRERGGEKIKVFGGGGGVIVPAEIEELHRYGVARIFSPEDGQRLGLQGMINEVVSACDFDLAQDLPKDLAALKAGDTHLRTAVLARCITGLEAEAFPPKLRDEMLRAADASKAPVLGVTGTGGAGKSSLVDELIRRFRLDREDRLKIAIISIDPSRRKSGGALLGDRIRMNAIQHPNIYMRSMATRAAGTEVSKALPDAIAACKVAGFDLVVVETSGIGQGDAAIVPLADCTLYVMTPEFGAAIQLEKIDMLDFADFVAINKFDRKGAQDALRDVRKQYQRNRELFSASLEEMPVYGTIASRFNDDGVTALYQALVARLVQEGLVIPAPAGIQRRSAGSDVAPTKASGVTPAPDSSIWGQAPDGVQVGSHPGKLPLVTTKFSTGQNAIVPPARVRYLAEIAETVRGYHGWAKEQARTARERQQLTATKAMLLSEPSSPQKRGSSDVAPVDQTTLDSRIRGNDVTEPLNALIAERDAALDPRAKKLLAMWPQTKAAYTGDEYVVKIRGKEIRTALTTVSLSGTHVPKVALPKFE
ncbi:MAG TPA: GTP-binding protein, partial [Casimicrobiaceae bacterium]